MNIDEAYIGFNPNRQIIASDDYSTNSSDVLATTKCVVQALAEYSALSSNGMPNFSNVVDITPPNNINTISYTAPYDGYLSIIGTINSLENTGSITVDMYTSENVLMGKTVVHNIPNVDSWMGVFLPVPKGAKVSYLGRNLGGVTLCKFIKSSLALS